MKTKNKLKLAFIVIIIILVTLACGVPNLENQGAAIALTVEAELTEISIQAPTDPPEIVEDGDLTPGLDVNLTAIPSATSAIELAPTEGVIAVAATATSSDLTPPVVLSTLNFEFNFSEVYTCFGAEYISLLMENIGSDVISSTQTTIEGPVGNVVGEFMANYPVHYSLEGNDLQCDSGGDHETLSLGTSGFLHVYIPNLPTGTGGKATVKACSMDDLGGLCTTKTIEFVWP